ncbi:MAG: metallophosphoesterase family protein [Myxococcales bacterium]|nr:metallophosphoesterase family protein [Myxococcales bacterium]
MKIGVYSDVHSNLIALREVLACYEKMDDIEYFTCLGDVVGYGAYPQECSDIVRAHVRYTVLGNHDAAVSGRMDYNYYYPAARKALDHHTALLSDENLAWLKSLPYKEYEGGICYCHGCPVSPENFDYVFTPEQAQDLMAHWDDLAHVTLIGHSHLTKSFRMKQVVGGEPEIEELESDLLHFEPDSKYIVTVGSVGQPRDNDGRACYTVLDTDAMTIQFFRKDYDIYSAAEAIWDDEHLAPDFGKRLFLGV